MEIVRIKDIAFSIAENSETEDYVRNTEDILTELEQQFSMNEYYP